MIIKLFMPAPVNPIMFSLSLLSLLHHPKQISLCVFIFSFCDQGCQHFLLGLGGRPLHTQWRDTIPIPPLTHVNTTTWARI